MNGIKQVTVCISGAVNGEPMLKEYTGEYEFRVNTHNIAYTDYSGNIITKCALQASGSEMLLHRTGGFSGDLWFDMQTDRIVKYDAFSASRGFMLHTDEYRLTEEQDGIRISVKYVMYDGSEQDMICGELHIEIKEKENE